jgi:hypothetical protein
MARAARSRVGRVPQRARGKGNALAKVRKFFPNVESVEDATESLKIEVTARDVSTSKRRAHSECAMAVACKRSQNLDGVIIATSTAYLIKGKDATRYNVPESVAREVVSFDRGASFEAGTYHLDVPRTKLGEWKGKGGQHQTRGTGPKFHHLTANVRAVLGSDRER